MSPTVFLTQLLPLIVFIIVDALVTDVRISITCAIVFAAGQLVYTYLKTRQLDWFVLLDVMLIAVLGGVSIALENELFFKIKPAIIEAVGVVFMLALILAPPSFLLGYLGRLSPAPPRPEALGVMRAMLGWLTLYTVVHIGAVLYTAPRGPGRDEGHAGLADPLHRRAHRRRALHRVLHIQAHVGRGFGPGVLRHLHPHHDRGSASALAGATGAANGLMLRFRGVVTTKGS